MKTGISTASLFGRYYTEDALKILSDNKVETCEIFLESFCEYERSFGELLNSRKGDTEIHSIHTLTTQFEVQLYSLNDRARKDSFALLENTMQAAEACGAKYYTFHGQARLKRTPITIDFERYGNITRKITEICAAHGVTLAYENVHWAYYNYLGFFSELKKRVPELRGTLDIKQARQSGVFYGDFIDEMGKDIVTAHLSDVDENGKMCLPGRGITDFEDVLKRLCDKGFDGALLLEVYKQDFTELSELLDSMYYIKDLAEKIF